MEIKNMEMTNLIDAYINVICENKIYIIKSGDTLSGIAKKYKLSVQDLMEINGIADPDKIIEGNKLIIPSPKISNARSTNKASYKKYKVKSGDSLSVIAKKYKVTVQQLVKLNKIKDENVIREGMILLIPIRSTNSSIKNQTKNKKLIKNKNNNPNINRNINNSNSNDTQNITGGDWIQSLTMPFVIKWQGKVTDNDGNHVTYDDNVNVTNKNHWDGSITIDEFINSCVGKPTIGYGETANNMVKKGKISDSEAKSLLLNRLKNLDKFLSKKYVHYNKMNPNQRTALISFSYNLGRDFIQKETKKMIKHLLAGNLDAMCSQMHDCDNVTQNGELIKVPGLTRRRQDEMALFRTPYKK